jgi:hypothetical protein
MKNITGALPRSCQTQHQNPKKKKEGNAARFLTEQPYHAMRTNVRFDRL